VVPGGLTTNPRVSGFRKARRGPGPSPPLPYRIAHSDPAIIIPVIRYYV